MSVTKETVSLWTPATAAVTGIAASLCCILPVLAAFGVIGSAALAGAFQRYRPWLIGLTAVLLGWGYYRAFLRSKPVECADGVCRLPAPVGLQRWLLVVATVVAVAAISLPWWVGYILE